MAEEETWLRLVKDTFGGVDDDEVVQRFLGTTLIKNATGIDNIESNSYKVTRGTDGIGHFVKSILDNRKWYTKDERLWGLLERSTKQSPLTLESGATRTELVLISPGYGGVKMFAPGSLGFFENFRDASGNVDATVFCAFGPKGYRYVVVKEGTDQTTGIKYWRLPQLQNVAREQVISRMSANVRDDMIKEKAVFFDWKPNYFTGRRIWAYAVLLQDEPVMIESGCKIVSLEDFWERVRNEDNGGFARSSRDMLCSLQFLGGFGDAGMSSDRPGDWLPKYQVTPASVRSIVVDLVKSDFVVTEIDTSGVVPARDKEVMLKSPCSEQLDELADGYLGVSRNVGGRKVYTISTGKDATGPYFRTGAGNLWHSNNLEEWTKFVSSGKMWFVRDASTRDTIRFADTETYIPYATNEVLFKWDADSALGKRDAGGFLKVGIATLRTFDRFLDVLERISLH